MIIIFVSKTVNEINVVCSLLQKKETNLMMAVVATERCTKTLLSDRNNFDGFKNQANQMATEYGISNEFITKQNKTNSD